MAVAAPPAPLLDLDPSRLTDQTYATRQRRELVDMSALVSLMIITLLLLPSVLGIPQLSTIGRPALVIGLLLTALWAFAKPHPRLAIRGPQPIRWAIGLWLVTLLLAYAAGQARGLTELEASSTDRTMIYLLVFCGIVLACADGIPSRRRLDDLVRMMVWGAAGMAIIGILQALLELDLTVYMQIPGFVFHHELVGYEERAGFQRIASTTSHYIEFSAVMAITLPFAIHVARFGRTSLARQLGTIAAVLVAAAVPLTLSRTGILAVLVMAVTLVPTWPWRTRLNVLAGGVVLLGVAILGRPGMVGTLISLFTNWSGDDSIQGRTGRYDIVADYFQEHPWLGRGPGTFVPELYLILDNQWLGMLVAGGIIGVVGLAGVHLTAIWLGRRIRRHTTNPADRDLAACLITAQVIAIVGAATFDSFAFTTFATTVAICTGFTGALWRLTHPSRQVRTVGARLGR